MKKPFLFLLSAGTLAWSLAGCTTSAGARAASGHTLTTNPRLAIDLPAWTGEHEAPALAERTISSPVVGLDESAVLQMLGRPTERPMAGLWIYWRYYSREQAAEANGADTLVVAFTRGRVSTMRIVKGEDLRAQLTNLGVSLASKPL